MTVLEMYERVCLNTNLDQRRFLNYLNDTQNELKGRYGQRIRINVQEIQDISDEALLDGLFHPAMVENILYLAELGDKHRERFYEMSEAAFLNLWNKNARGKKVKPLNWEGCKYV